MKQELAGDIKKICRGLATLEQGRASQIVKGATDLPVISDMSGFIR